MIFVCTYAFLPSNHATVSAGSRWVLRSVLACRLTGPGCIHVRVLIRIYLAWFSILVTTDNQWDNCTRRMDNVGRTKIPSEWLQIFLLLLCPLYVGTRRKKLHRITICFHNKFSNFLSNPERFIPRRGDIISKQAFSQSVLSFLPLGSASAISASSRQSGGMHDGFSMLDALQAIQWMDTELSQAYSQMKSK